MGIAIHVAEASRQPRAWDEAGINACRTRLCQNRFGQ
jgi:hypothetical protein